MDCVVQLVECLGQPLAGHVAGQAGCRLHAQPDLEQPVYHPVEQVPGDLGLIGHRPLGQIEQVITPLRLGGVADHREDEGLRGGGHRAQGDLDRQRGPVLAQGGEPRPFGHRPDLGFPV